MPLRDHFRPPLSEFRDWRGFLTTWAVILTAHLNRHILPSRYFAESKTRLPDFGDVPATEDTPAANAVMDAILPDEFEIAVIDVETGHSLAGVIKLVSPANKARRDTRRLFAAKCAAYLQQRIGLIILDIVTSRFDNLHDELIHLLGSAKAYEFPAGDSLYATAYRPVRNESADQIEIWTFPLAIGQPLPVAPLHLRGLLTVPVDLETTYTTACQDSRI
jgi:hypothetical protein